MPVDRRDKTRQKLLLSGILEWNGSSIECVVRDISETGAKVSTPLGAAICDIVTLTIPTLRRRYDAWVLWRLKDGIGLRFDLTLSQQPPSGVAMLICDTIADRITPREVLRRKGYLTIEFDSVTHARPVFQSIALSAAAIKNSIVFLISDEVSEHFSAADLVNDASQKSRMIVATDRCIVRHDSSVIRLPRDFNSRDLFHLLERHGR